MIEQFKRINDFLDCVHSNAYVFTTAKSVLYIVRTIAEHAYDHALKRALKLSTYCLQIFLVKYEYLQSLKLCEDQGIRGKLKNCVRKHVLGILTTHMETRLWIKE